MSWRWRATASAYRAGLRTDMQQSALVLLWFGCIRCSGTHQRSLLWPLGNKGFGFVSDGNVMAARVALLCLYSAAQGCRFLVEQPAGSSAPIHPRLVQLFNSIQAGNLCFFKVCLVNVFFAGLYLQHLGRTICH